MPSETLSQKTHITYRDLNGDGVPQADEISANVDRFFFTCH